MVVRKRSTKSSKVRRGASRGSAPSGGSDPSPNRVKRLWQALSRPWRWVIVVTPAVALVVGLVGDSLSLWERFTEDSPAVSVQDVAVSQQGEVGLVLTSIASTEFRQEVTWPATSVTFSLNNPQDTAVALYEIRATVLDAAVLRDCAVAGGDIQVTGDYQLPLPEAEVEATTSADIAWQVAGNQNDRLSVTLGNPHLTTLERIPLYHLDFELRTGEGTWLPAGTVVMANELPHFGAFFDAADEVFGGCAADNLAALDRFLEKPGERSPELALLAEAVTAINRDGASRYLGQDCPFGNQQVNDVYPADVIPNAVGLELAVAVECRKPDGFENFGAIVELVSPAQPEAELFTYVPIPQLRATDLTFVDGTLLLRYTETGDEFVGVEEELAIVDGSLTVVERSEER